MIHIHVLICLLCTLIIAEAVVNEGVATELKVRFHVPFTSIIQQGLDMESVSTKSVDLRVKRVVSESASTCSASDTSCNSRGHSSVNPSLPLIRASDRLVAVDGMPLSLKSFQQAIDMPVGSFVILPLFKPVSNEDDSNILSGFARIEILRPQEIEFEPTTPERIVEIQEWQAAIAKKEQEELARQIEEKERMAALENEKIEKKAQEDREKAERARLEITPHEHVRQKRNEGKEFRYEVLFPNNGPIGLNWDLQITDKAVVSYLEPKLAAERFGVIAPKDQLIRLNEVDTTVMGPHEVVQLYLSSSPPRTLVFMCAGTASSRTTITAEDTHQSRVQNWTMSFDEPAILNGWQARLHLATWSSILTFVNESMELTLASPITACVPLPTITHTATSRGVYLTYRGGCSFIDKAHNIARTHADALIVVNNVKGDGRFPTKMPTVENVESPVMMISKVEGELLMSVVEYQPVRFRIHEEDPSKIPLLNLQAPRKLTNEELTIRRDVKKSARTLTFWYANDSSLPSPSKVASVDFRVLPALFGGNITTAPYRVVMAYPQDTACHPQGLGVLATRSVILVKRGGCSFGAKAKSVQEVGGIGMLLINSDESLIPLMSEPKDVDGIMIWAASIGHKNGTLIQHVLERNKNLPSLVKITMDDTTKTGSETSTTAAP